MIRLPRTMRKRLRFFALLMAVGASAFLKDTSFLAIAKRLAEDL